MRGSGKSNRIPRGQERCPIGCKGAARGAVKVRPLSIGVKRPAGHARYRVSE